MSRAPLTLGANEPGDRKDGPAVLAAVVALNEHIILEDLQHFHREFLPEQLSGLHRDGKRQAGCLANCSPANLAHLLVRHFLSAFRCLDLISLCPNCQGLLFVTVALTLALELRGVFPFVSANHRVEVAAPSLAVLRHLLPSSLKPLYRINSELSRTFFKPPLLGDLKGTLDGLKT